MLLIKSVLSRLTLLHAAVVSSRDLFDRPGGDDSHALPFVRLPLGRSPVGRVDDDAGDERPARAAERSGGEDVRWRASLRPLSRRRERSEIREEIRNAAVNRKDGSHLPDTPRDVSAALGAVRVRAGALR